MNFLLKRVVNADCVYIRICAYIVFMICLLYIRFSDRHQIVYVKWTSICSHLRLHIIQQLFWCKYMYHHYELWIMNSWLRKYTCVVSFDFAFLMYRFASFWYCWISFRSLCVVSNRVFWFRFVLFRFDMSRFVSFWNWSISFRSDSRSFETFRFVSICLTM